MIVSASQVLQAGIIGGLLLANLTGYHPNTTNLLLGACLILNVIMGRVNLSLSKDFESFRTHHSDYVLEVMAIFQQHHILDSHAVGESVERQINQVLQKR